MLNHCTFFGRLTADPEIRQAGENSVVGKFTIAVERDIPGKDGERGVDFIHCVAWNQLARFLSGYFQKGSAILVCGRLQMSRWKDENGSPHERAEISADTLYFGESSASKKAPFLLTPIRWIKQYDSYQITPHTVRLPITGSFFIFRR